MARKQIMVEPPAATAVGGLGHSDLSVMHEAFPGSPVYQGALTDVVAEAQYYVDENADGEMSDGGHTFGTINRNYNAAPDINDVAIGGGGLPGNARAPNIASPPEGQNPADIPESGVDATAGAKGHDGAWIGGESANPANTSVNIGRQTVGHLTLGKSGV